MRRRILAFGLRVLPWPDGQNKGVSHARKKADPQAGTREPVAPNAKKWFAGGL
jgi:hypothetical protein